MKERRTLTATVRDMYWVASPFAPFLTLPWARCAPLDECFFFSFPISKGQTEPDLKDKRHTHTPSLVLPLSWQLAQPSIWVLWQHSAQNPPRLCSNEALRRH